MENKIIFKISIQLFAMLVLCIASLQSYFIENHRNCSQYMESCNGYMPCCNPKHFCKFVNLGVQNELKCINYAYLGERCNNSSDCNEMINAECSENICDCKPNFINSVDSCKPLLNEFCIDNRDCIVKNSICVDHKCKCNSNFTSKSNNACEPLYLGRFCELDEDCDDIRHAKCSNNKCSCRANNVGLIKECVPLVNAFCWNDESCYTNNSVCIDNTCRCKPNFTLTPDKQCLPSYLGTYCKSDLDCRAIKNARCSPNNQCVCKFSAVKLDERTCGPLITGICVNSSQCIPDNSYCVNNQCQCEHGYKPLFNAICEKVEVKK
ncbi:prion-like-(Q/N-rich) domain-bearing protein 25 isoform X2 [Microplitis demolitor]|uniref:prion-like-(Q/N-rich) domain-bearing protein 25 isoform X2 n=1 Tax=Microplitis demolitor TaxID=69319 RepID=UPI0004CD2034|nr:prion-like-(Q/N-rich) domain-bearing protein 25 isoform X2 [Microplitis demolitor]